MWILGIVAAGMAVTFGVGALIQFAQGSEGRITGPSVPPPVGCDDLCRDLLLARTRRCNEEARLRNLSQYNDNLKNLWERTMLMWLGLTAAAMAAAAIPFIGGWIAASLTAAAVTAYALTLVLAGMLAVATRQWWDQNDETVRAREREEAALAAMLMNCSPEEQTSCLARLMPCP